MKSLLTLMLLVVCLTVITASGQPRSDSTGRKKAVSSQVEQKVRLSEYFQRSLGLDKAKAEKVAQIQTEYKAGMKAMMEDKRVDESTRQKKIEALKAEKNRQLEGLLNSSQQQKAIPFNERYPSQEKKKN